MSGAEMIYNRYTLQNQLSNSYITMQIYKELKSNQALYEHSNINLTTFNYDVLVSGQTTDSQYHDQILEIVRHTPGVKRIYDDMDITRPTTMWQQLTDSWITTKIKTKIWIMNTLDPNQIKIVTENGVVYVMGKLDPKAAPYLTRVIQNTAGVHKVVKMIHYIIERDTA